jgi:hypothetical protein
MREMKLTQGDIDHGIEPWDLAVAHLDEFIQIIDNYDELSRNPVMLGFFDMLLGELEIEYYSYGRAPKRREVSPQLRKMVFERDAYRCRECDDYHDLVIDHIFPISRGGTNAVENLQTLCGKCNSLKATSYPYGYPGDLP